MMRIVSLAPSNTEILYELGLGEQVVATTGYCDYPDDAKEKPSVGGWTNADVDAVQRFDPDVVLTSTFVQAPIRDQIQEQGISLIHVEPTTLDEVYDSILEIGARFNQSKDANHIVDTMKTAMQEHRENQPSATPTVYCEEWHDPPSVGGNWIPELVEIAGGSQNYVEPGDPSKPVTPERVQESEPSIAILHWCGYDDRTPEDAIRQREGWSEIPFNTVDSVHDDILNRPGPRLTEGCEAIQRVIRREADADI